MQSLSYIYGKFKYDEIKRIVPGPTQMEGRSQNSTLILLCSSLWDSFLVSLCSICQSMIRAENILNQFSQAPHLVIALFWEHLVYYRIWSSSWSFIHIRGQLLSKNWPSDYAGRSRVKTFFSWKLHITYLECVVISNLYKAGVGKAMPYKTPKYISNPVSPAWSVLDLLLCKYLSDIFVHLTIEEYHYNILMFINRKSRPF